MLSLRSQAAHTRDEVAGDGIAVVVLTHDRQPLLQGCVENVLQRASEQTREIVIWNNASTDATREYLDSPDDPRIRAVHSERNVGQSGYARGFALTTSPFLVELDDDVTGAPADWDVILRDAFKRLPSIGFLGADLEDDPNDQASHYRHHVRPHEYTEAVENGIRLFKGPSAQDRVLALDYLYIIAMLMMLALGIRYASDTYFEAALLIALFGFVGSFALAKFLLRGEVIE